MVHQWGVLMLIGSNGGSLDALKGRVDFQHIGKDLGALSFKAVGRNTAYKLKLKFTSFIVLASKCGIINAEVLQLLGEIGYRVCIRTRYIEATNSWVKL